MSKDRLIPLPDGSPYTHIIVDADNDIFGPTELQLLQLAPLRWLNTHRAPDQWQLGFAPSVRHLLTNGSLRAMILGPAAKNRRRKTGTAQNDFRRSAFHLDINPTAHRAAATTVGVTIKRAVRSFVARWKQAFTFR